MSLANVNLNPQINTELYVGNPQVNADPGNNTQVQLGDRSHAISPDRQSMHGQPSVQNDQPFPDAPSQNTISNARNQLNLPNAANTTQSQPIGSRTVAAGRAKPAKKTFAFTFKQLDDISKGKYNVGEIRLTKGGKLEKINNHVGYYSDKNTVVTTPQENARLRQQVFDCIADKYGEALSQDAKAVLRDILLGDGRDALSLSRDELGRILKGVKDGQLDGQGGPGSLNGDLASIRAFKAGGAEAAGMRGLIKGLQTDPDNAVVSQVSKNAKCDIVRDFAHRMSTGLDQRLSQDPAGRGLRAMSGLAEDFAAINLALGQGNGLNLEFADGNVVIHRSDLVAIVKAAAEQVDVDQATEKSRPGETEGRLKGAFCDKLNGLLRGHYESRIMRKNGQHTNPALALERNTFLRQSMYKIDNNGVTRPTGTNTCFVNSMVNAVLATGGVAAKGKLASLFTPGGCKLYDGQGNLSEPYSYSELDLSEDGNVSYYEQTLNKHFQKDNEHYNYSSGEFSQGLNLLGLKGSDQLNAIKVDVMFGGNDVAGFVKTLSDHLKGGKMATIFERNTLSNGAVDSHFTALKGIRLNPGEPATLTMSIVDDRYNAEKGSFEYEKTMTLADFKARLGANTLDVNVFEV